MKVGAVRSCVVTRVLPPQLHLAVADMEQEKFELQKKHTESIQELVEDTNQRLAKMETEYSVQTQATVRRGLGGGVMVGGLPQISTGKIQLKETICIGMTFESTVSHLVKVWKLCCTTLAHAHIPFDLSVCVCVCVCVCV